MVQLLGKDVGTTGYGLMGFTWRPKPTPNDAAIEAMHTALASGCTNWNGGEFYGPPERNSLQLLNAYFTKYPEDADKVIICIKGGADPTTVHPTGDEKGIRRSVDQCLKVLDGKKKLDLFECARVDPKVPIEDSIAVLAQYVKEGKLGGISLSEVGAETIKRAASVHKISAVEIEFSMFSPDCLENGVAQTCAELGIPIVAYSPLGRGFLTGEIKSPDDIPEGDFRKGLPRFQPDNFATNLKLVDEVEKVAKKKGCTNAQIALAWVKHQSGRGGLPEILPIPGATTEKRILENTKEVVLADDEFDELNAIVKQCTVVGGRYPPGPLTALEYA